jgi:diadenosine tetraphosphate (Ap4A) HIT family hydrolase
MHEPDPTCPLCLADAADSLWHDDFCRVIWVDEPDYPGFCRVILNAHVREMTDLTERERDRLMQVVWAVEAGVREVIRPDKVNLASLGNVVAHLHWHVIPRFAGDRHFPDPIWAAPRRAAENGAVDPGIRARLSRQIGRFLRPPE